MNPRLRARLAVATGVLALCILVANTVLVWGSAGPRRTVRPAIALLSPRRSEARK